MSSRDCPAGGDHVFQDFVTELFGSFNACNKCGIRSNELCPQTPAGHGDHRYEPSTEITQHGIITVGKCAFCGKVFR